jgi:hypothetical protein
MKRLLMAIVCLTVAAAAFGQVPKPAPELHKLEPLIGDWKCTGELFTSEEFGPGHPVVSTVTGIWTLGGFWLEMHFAEKKTEKSPEPYDALIFLSYDNEIKRFVFGSVDNTGSYETAQAGGWQGDVITFEGPIHTGNKTLTARDQFRKTGTTEIFHTFTLKVGEGWKKIEEDRCRRAKK